MRHLPRLLSPALLTLALFLPAGCARFPDLDATITAEARAADYPDLLPISDVLSVAEDPARLAPADGDSLDARAAGLRARADRLRRHRMAPLPTPR
ncbi:hypothetical protein [Pseudooceanicola aestuarii]|uniref:hypothetical protein n=1 Tax=Pseudooceanicola aestuarii TaxID=2697319 RepID=UPI0013D3CE07|nr:hypothetical protein [Pseudooceanicola aestuarii]